MIKFSLGALAFCASASALATPKSYVVGDNVRIQILSPSLIRLEEKGPRGFEDRSTFTVVNREIAPQGPAIGRNRDGWIITTSKFVIHGPTRLKGLSDVMVDDLSGHAIYRFKGKLPPHAYLPAPGNVPTVWPMSDNPRLVPPAWGATPAPTSVDPALAAKSGWDDRNDAPDIYLFIPGKGGYGQLRKDFLALTGPVPKPPLYILGFIDSRWKPYTEQDALNSIDEYRKRQIPMDTFVVDTDWRVSGSAGYDVATNYFPDMARFIREAHGKHAHLMYNDHPDPKAQTSFDPKELAYRWGGLSKLLDWGMDVWWYDRNWSTSLHEPMPGIAKEVWGQRMYHDMTQKDRPEQRPWIMTNAEGIDNGNQHYPPHPAGHRYPMMWTGDTGSQFSFLKKGVENGVDRGVLALQPYTHEDLGGHTGPTPSPELYVRYLEYGCLSPITRVHCTLGQDRHPWAYGPEAEKIVTDYIKLRYRLLPMLYSAAQRTVDDGTPMLRRCDLEWPTYPEAASNDQYLLGDDLLVAPIERGILADTTPIPKSFLTTPAGSKQGLKAEYFDNPTLEGNAKVVKTDSQIDFDWSGGQPDPAIPQENFSARWTGNIGPLPSSGTYTITTVNDDGVRVFIDDKQIIDDWKPEDSVTRSAKIQLEAGTTHRIKVEYMQLTGGAVCRLGWIPPTQQKGTAVHRSVWVPPGAWRNLWTGEEVKGPKTIETSAELNQIPMWAREGGMVVTGPELQYTGEKRMDPLNVHVYLGGNGTTARELDEDDGISTEYLKGKVARTKLRLVQSGDSVTLKIEGAKGSFKGMVRKRHWLVTLHLPPNRTVQLPSELKPVYFNSYGKSIPLSSQWTSSGRGSDVIFDLGERSNQASQSLTFKLR